MGGTVLLHGEKKNLVGELPEPGTPAPDTVLLNSDAEKVSISDFKGSTTIILSLGSVDTSVCDVETKRFNQEVDSLDGNIKIAAVSMDLPFALGRWCAAGGINKVTMLSDHFDASFGTAFGVLVKETRLLARAVFILAPDNTVQYVQLVPEITTEPNYDEVLAKVKEISGQ